MNIYLNDEDIRYLEQLDTRVKDGDVSRSCPRSPAANAARDVQLDDHRIDAIGNTPLVELPQLSPEARRAHLRQARGPEPGGSVEGPHRAST